MDVARFYAVLVTYRRPDDLRRTLAALGDQTRRPDGMIVVDNAPSDETRAIVRSFDEASAPVRYMPMPENVGFTGGVAAAMAEVLTFAGDDDWIVVCDDDDPPSTSDAFAELMAFADEMRKRDPRTAGVGLGGGRFDFRRGRIVRVPTQELDGAVALDYIGGGYFGCYRVAAVRAVGPWDPAIFFGFSEGEFGLRLRRAGYSLWGHGRPWRERRIAAGRADHVAKPSALVGIAGWRRYYSLRNLIYVLRQHGHVATALRVSIINGFAKPLLNLVVRPRVALAHLRWNVKAVNDGWRNRMGRRVEPVPWGPRPVEGRRASAGTR